MFFSWTGCNGQLADGTDVKTDGTLVRPDGTIVPASDVKAAGGLDAWVRENLPQDEE